jgi:hypothetical protein
MKFPSKLIFIIFILIITFSAQEVSSQVSNIIVSEADASQVTTFEFGINPTLSPRIVVNYANILRSNTLQFPIELVGDTLPPIISNLYTNITEEGNVIIQWQTDEYAGTALQYGTDPDDLPNLMTNNKYSYLHEVLLTGLDQCTTYYFIVSSTDRSGNEASEEGSFITDCLPTVTFSSAAYSVGESDSTATITVNLSNPSSVDVQVTYATSNGTAMDGYDYIAKSGILSFTSGDISGTFTVTILNDGIDEPSETVNLTLSSPINASLGIPSSAQLTIIDNDLPPSDSIMVILPIILK